LAWVFVITRYVHAFIYIGFNDVPLRFTAFLTGVFTLVVIPVMYMLLDRKPEPASLAATAPVMGDRVLPREGEALA